MFLTDMPPSFEPSNETAWFYFCTFEVNMYQNKLSSLSSLTVSNSSVHLIPKNICLHNHSSKYNNSLTDYHFKLSTFLCKYIWIIKSLLKVKRAWVHSKKLFCTTESPLRLAGNIFSQLLFFFFFKIIFLNLKSRPFDPHLYIYTCKCKNKQLHIAYLKWRKKNIKSKKVNIFLKADQKHLILNE